MRQKFVCVRVTRMNGINLRRFEFDYDTTWNAFFVDQDLNVYSRYGGRDAGEPEARLSKASLLQTMNEVLAAHTRRKRASANERKELIQPIDTGVFRPEDIPLLKKSHQGCVHCHQVREYQYLQWAEDKEFSRRKIFRWPLPEGIGLTIDRKHGHRIERVDKDSAADKAGLRPGDVIAKINDVPIHSEYDMRWAMGRAEEDKPLLIAAVRDEKPVVVNVQPRPGWRETDIGWRKSMRSLPLQFGFRGYSLTRTQRKDLGLTETQLAVRIVSVRDKGLCGSLKLQRKDTIIEAGGVTTKRTLEGLKSDLIRRYKAGDTVTVTVLREGRRIQLTGSFPAWQTDETSVP